MTIKPSQIFDISDENAFNRIATDIFRYQYNENVIYKNYINLLNINTNTISHINDIPFLPVELFKTHCITTLHETPSFYFESSGTGGDRSRHYYQDLNIYEQSFSTCFELFYGAPAPYALLALLPSYSENPNSSLIYMASKLIAQSSNPMSGFYNNNPTKLYDVLLKLRSDNTPTILIGVSFALLGFCEKFSLQFPELIVIETGGMKGRLRELLREELHAALCKGFGVKTIHSEYGMTELFSQAYSAGNGIFRCPPWMKVLARDTDNPLAQPGFGKGALNIIDLANTHSCAFIATEDLGTVYPDGSFTVTGRMDNTQLRGCNLLV